MIRAVIDTNVLVSGLISPTRNEALILLAVHQGSLRPCLSEAIITEYAAVLARPKFSFPEKRIAALLATLRQCGEVFGPGIAQARSLDPADAEFLHSAEVAQADFIITGNKRHFPQALYGETRVVNAAELLDRITRELW
jgi:putative PIN family toxin of toxin-antitoxin system